MVIENPTQETLECLKFVELYLDQVQKKMGEYSFLAAYVFGPLARNEGSVYETANVLFVFPTSLSKPEYPFVVDDVNLPYAWKQEDIHHDFNTKAVDIFQYRIVYPTRIKIQPHFYYPGIPFGKLLYVSNTMSRSLFENIAPKALKYPEDITDKSSIF